MLSMWQSTGVDITAACTFYFDPDPFRTRGNERFEKSELLEIIVPLQQGEVDWM